MLLTRSRLCPRPKPGSSLHLHVLGTPPAFVLSQDQTLREELLGGERSEDRAPFTKSRQGLLTRFRRRLGRTFAGKTLGLSLVGPDPCAHTREPTYTGGSGAQDGVNSGTVAKSVHADRGATVIEPGHTSAEGRPRVRMLLSFQRPSHLFRRDFLRRHAREQKLLSGRTGEYSAEQRPRKNAPGSTSAPINRPHKIAGLATECRPPVVGGVWRTVRAPVGWPVGPVGGRFGPRWAALSGQRLRIRQPWMGRVSLGHRLSQRRFRYAAVLTGRAM